MEKKYKTLDQLTHSNILYLQKLPPIPQILILTVSLCISLLIITSFRFQKVSIVLASGSVASNKKATIVVPFSGEITTISTDEGDLVSSGDILFTLASPDVEMEINKLTAQRTIYETQIEQYGVLIEAISTNTNLFDSTKDGDRFYFNLYESYQGKQEQNVVDVAQLDYYGYSTEQIELELEKNQAAIKALYHSTLQDCANSISESQNQIDLLAQQLYDLQTYKESFQVKAKSSGIVHLHYDIEPGMQLQVGNVIGSIAADNDEYIIKAYIDAADILHIKEGDPVEISITGLPETIYGTLSGTVSRIDNDSTTIETEGGKSAVQYKVEIKPDHPYLQERNSNIVPISNGMLVEAKIQYKMMSYFEYILQALGLKY